MHSSIIRLWDLRYQKGTEALEATVLPDSIVKVVIPHVTSRLRMKANKIRSVLIEPSIENLLVHSESADSTQVSVYP